VAKNKYRESVSSNAASLLRQERERRGVSMTRLAEMAGLSQGMISLVEHEHRNPSLDTLLRICIALKIDLSKVLSRAELAAKKTASK
jgi:transcriptional regulator with XRE-family HTH domain